ncbi:MAG TPA: lysylphosphatidylglycerol synthase domain-containing protein [Candidatus Sulfotelmatobacter sp.]|nr:lysylphosphatidylglycerol synthase domain-containing protein [Candidatus Sulfotelmatobacter sp.]
MKKLHTLLLLLGFGFLGYLVWRVGADRLWQGLLSLGWGLIPFIAFEFLAEGLHTKGWSYCMGGAYRRLSWFQLFRIRLAGNAINYLTPTAAMGGEITKAGLLSSSHKGPEAVSSVLVGRLSTGIAHALFVACGSVVVVCGAHLPRPVWVAMFGSGGFVVSGMLAFLLLQKYGKFGSFIRWLAARRFGGRLLRKVAREVSTVDEALKTFYRERPSDLAPAIGWQMLGHSTGLLQTWWFLSLVHQAYSIETVATLWVLGMWFDLLTFAVPLNMGTLEGTRIVAFKAVGMGALTGMTYGIALRLAQLSVVSFGLANYLLFVRNVPTKTAPRPVRPPRPVPAGESGR